VTAERQEEHALVWDAAARFAPTLGFLGALLALMRLVELPTWSAGLPHSLAAALVAAVYGIAVSSLVCQPLATRLRAQARVSALRRDLTIHGVQALRDGAAPSVLEERLAGYLQRHKPAPLADVA
jgi:chemotaxis protein MotA